MRLLPFLKTSWFSCYDCNLKWIKSQEQIYLQEGGSEHETYFAIFYWQWRCHLCRAGHVSISRGEVSAYLQSVCIQIGFSLVSTVMLGHWESWLLSRKMDGSWIKPICELDHSLLKSPSWIGLKYQCHVISVSSRLLRLMSKPRRCIIPKHQLCSACHPLRFVMGGLVSIFNCDWN